MRYMVWQLTNRKVVSIRLPPMEPISMLWLVQHRPPASMHSRSASPRARDRPQVPMGVPMVGGHCTALADPVDLLRVFDNLLENARRYGRTPPDTVHERDEGESVFFGVEDFSVRAGSWGESELDAPEHGAVFDGVGPWCDRHVAPLRFENRFDSPLWLRQFLLRVSARYCITVWIFARCYTRENVGIRRFISAQGGS